MVGLSTSDRRDEGGLMKMQRSPKDEYTSTSVPYSLSEGSGRSIGLSGLQGEGGNRYGMSCSVYIYPVIVPCVNQRNE